MTNELTKITGIGERTAEVLAEHGYDTLVAIAGATNEALAEVPGFSLTRAEKVILEARTLQSSQASTDTEKEDIQASIAAVSKKLQEKKHTKTQHVQAAHAIALYYELLDSKSTVLSPTLALPLHQ